MLDSEGYISPPPALAHDPGRFGAVVVADGDPRDVRAAARSLLQARDARLVVGVSAFAARDTALAGVNVDAPFRNTPFPVGRPGLFVQIAAESRDERDALEQHTLQRIRRQGLFVVASHRLAAIEPGPREAFGFLDPFRARRLTEAYVSSGPAAGAAVIITQAFVQDVARFTTRPLQEQERDMGVRKKDGHVVKNPPASAHVTRMRHGDYAMVRRGLPFEDRRGLFFIAHARDGAVLARALQNLVDGDAMMAFAWPESGAVFITVPSAASLDPFRADDDVVLARTRALTVGEPIVDVDGRATTLPASTLSAPTVRAAIPTEHPSNPSSTNASSKSPAGTPAQERL
jgi:hypothetical protein